jgi:YfiH family protein
MTEDFSGPPPPVIAAPALERRLGLRHGFFTRRGGVSEGIYGTLNCGFGSRDKREKVAENRRRAAAALGVAPGSLITAYQVHGTEVATVEAPWDPAAAPKADAMVTTRPGIALGILAADCAPVLFADTDAGVIGACHAGWRGALTGVIEATVAAMERLGAGRARMTAVVGPAIGRLSYEVGPEFPQPFLEQDAANRALFSPAARDGHFLFDLAGHVRDRLGGCGLAVVEVTGHDTCAEDGDLFSYRRACLRGEADFGRGLSAIVLDGKG